MRVLVANRGEIAARILRSIKKLGHTAIGLERYGHDIRLIEDLADEIVYFREDLYEVKETFLSIPEIIRIAEKQKIDAIHPGYGFLSESAEFSKKVLDSGMIFIGPSPETLSLLGDKILAKEFANSLGIPTIPGFEIKNFKDDISLYREDSEKLGFPLMVKASNGGGGKGMREIYSVDDLQSSLTSASSEAERAFGSGNLFIEKLIRPARHVEVQILGDSSYNCVHFFERDCSLQRKHQKLIEFSPAINISDSLLQKLFDDSIKLGMNAKLTNLATVEFLVNPFEEKYYFIESNPRLQVEHTVTEEVTDIDLVSLQIDVAFGSKCPKQSSVKRKNSSFQARICAETPEKNFIPSTGKCELIQFPLDTRVETSYLSESEISDDYDSLIAKLISKNNDWESARIDLVKALERTIVFGVNTNLSFLIKALAKDNFDPYHYSTSSLDALTKAIESEIFEEILASKALEHLQSNSSVSQKPDSFFSKSIKTRSFIKRFFYLAVPQLEILKKITLEEKEVSKLSSFESGYKAMVEGYECHYYKSFPLDLNYINQNMESDVIDTPLPCQIIEVYVKQGEVVKTGQKLLTFESMKTEYTKFSPYSGIVTTVYCKKDAKLKKGEILLIIEPIK